MENKHKRNINGLRILAMAVLALFTLHFLFLKAALYTRGCCLAGVSCAGRPACPWNGASR